MYFNSLNIHAYLLSLRNDQLAKLVSKLTNLRLSYPYIISCPDLRSPLEFAIDEGIVFKYDKNIYISPITESYRRHLLIYIPNNKLNIESIQEVVEILIPGNEFGRDNIYADKRSLFLDFLNSTIKNQICPKVLLKKEVINNEEILYNHVNLSNYEILVLEYIDGKRLDFYLLAKELKDVSQKSIVNQIQLLINLFHSKGIVGNELDYNNCVEPEYDMHTGNFRIIEVNKNLSVHYVGDFESFNIQYETTLLKLRKQFDIFQIIQGKNNIIELTNNMKEYIRNRFNMMLDKSA